ncbi:MAG: carboxypeptidase-like regulatory domain-containing protein, partial [Flavobacteriaceae bacterium]|nr:carboxypeptidase-like regulatory domain-containing protein [Flavobacteriaceae bacterium]
MAICWGTTIGQQAVIRGVVTDENQLPLPNVSVTVASTGTTTNENGFYSISLSSQTKQNLTFSHIGHKPATVQILLKPGEIFELNPVLSTEIDQFGEVIVRANAQAKIKGLISLTPSTIRNISGANAGVENLLLSLPGVNANNELSTQYAVRGGNYDENLVYVNEIEVYRPLLVRSGQQEGLSFLNPDLIQQVQFSAGGFEAVFGDKMSSVLDIQYRTFPGNNINLSASLLGGNISWGIEKGKWSAVTGVRYRDNSLLVNQKETETNYRPNYTDVQSFVTYRANDKLVFNALAAHSLNRYNYAPTTRQTNFGTIDQPIALVVFYQGNEVDRYQTTLGALKTTWLPNDRNSVRLIVSGYQAEESEYFDILAQYRLGEPNTDIGGNDLGEVMFTQGVGSQLTHARNNLHANIVEAKIKGKHVRKNHQLDWGVGFKKEQINDRLVEWEVIDSSGFSLRPPSGSITNQEPYAPFSGPLEAFQNVRTSNKTDIQRLTAYSQWSHKGLWGKTL